MNHWQTPFLPIATVLLALLAGLAVHGLLFRLAAALARRNRWILDEAILAALRRPSRLAFPLLALVFVLPGIPGLGTTERALLGHALAVGLIAAVTWAGVALVDAWAALIVQRHDIRVADNLEARRVLTQVTVLERTLVIVIVVLGVAAALMTFPRVREIGSSLLVSAGVAGLAIGLAARPVLENLVAGLQLAFTQPIRVDDVVIVEGEWGWIEEITATYVVVRIWDQRRLIVPLSYFISQPFQNWTRRSADILGTVFLHVDYTLPVQAVREELERLCRANPLWDGRVCVLQVTEAGERTLQLRALVSAASSEKAWDLRVALREQLVAFLQREHPDCLPQVRLDTHGTRRTVDVEA